MYNYVLIKSVIKCYVIIIVYSFNNICGHRMTSLMYNYVLKVIIVYNFNHICGHYAVLGALFILLYFSYTVYIVLISDFGIL